VTVVIHLDNAGTSLDQTCAPLVAGSACSTTGFASGTYRRWCKVTGGTKKNVRGSFCNDTTGVCVRIQ
jgi:hypothetical protein